MLVNNIKSLLLKSNTFCTDALYSAAGYCVSLGNYEVGIEHLLLKLAEADSGDVSLLLSKLDINKSQFMKTLTATIEEFDKGNTAKPAFSPLLLDLFESAWVISSVELSEKKIRSAALLMALITKNSYSFGSSYRDFFKDLSLDKVLKLFWEIAPLSKESDPATKESSDDAGTGRSGDSFLDKYCNDFTKKAAEGKIDAVFGRDQEIRQIVDVLARRRKNNPICVGEPGVGKTAVVEGLALRIIEGDVPDVLKNVRLIELDIGLLEAGAGMKGEFEKRLKGVIDEVKSSEIPIILFIDEAHTLIGAGNSQGGSDAANLLKPALARGELRTVAATTWSEYKKYFEKDPALARRFQPIKLDEPDVPTATIILGGLKGYYEKSHGVDITSAAIRAAAELSDRYINGRFLPDKAIDLLDTACARVKISITSKPPLLEDRIREKQALERKIDAINRDREKDIPVDEEELNNAKSSLQDVEVKIKEVEEKWQQEKKIVEEILKPENDQATLEKNTEELKKLQESDSLISYRVDGELIAKVVSDWTGIPLGRMLKDQTETILNLENYLEEKVKGQDHAQKEIGEVIRAAKSGLKSPMQPMGVFLLAGPSGVGKTETALTLAQIMFGSTKNMVTINMSEFQESHTTSRLVGSPPGYVGYGEGGVLTEAVRQKPYSVVLLDEVEKAHPDVLNLFYQVFDKGVLSDGEGKEIDFKNTVIILTSNLGSKTIAEFAGGVEGEINIDKLREVIADELKAHFKPALYARMTVVPFLPLGEEMLSAITKLKLSKINAQLEESKKISLLYDDAVLKAISRKCDDIETGARNIDFVLNKNVMPRLAKEILAAISESKKIESATISVNPEGMFEIEVK